MKWITTFCCCIVSILHGQEPDHNVFSRDSFPPFVKAVGITGYLSGMEASAFDSSMIISQSYFECDSTGRWKRRVDVGSGGLSADDTTWYDQTLHTRFDRLKNGYDESKVSTAFNRDGTVNSVFIDFQKQDDRSIKYDYDKQKRVVRCTETIAGLETVIDFVYNRKTGLLELKRTSTGNAGEKRHNIFNEEQYEYNEKKQCIKSYERFYGENNFMRLCDTVWFSYNDKDLLVEKRESRQNGTTKMHTAYEYDDSGRMIRKVYTYSTAEQPEPYTIINEWEFDDHGNWSMVSEEDSDGSGDAYTWDIKYNDRGLPESCTYETEAEIIYYVWEYEYR